MTRHNSSHSRKRFQRNKYDGVLGGVCAGLADYTGWDLLLIRVAALVLLFAGVGILIPIYIALWIFTPSARPVFADDADFRDRVREEGRRRPRTSVSQVSRKFQDLEQRLQDMEKSVTSGEWKLRREFREIE